MTQSAVVDSTYRIHAGDLQGLDLERRIINISYQGIEEMAPVLHLEGVAKRLVLDQALSGQMIALTRSPMPEDWVGARIRLHARGDASNPTIVITATDGSARSVRRLLAPIGTRWPIRMVKVILVLALLALMIWMAFQIGLTL